MKSAKKILSGLLLGCFFCAPFWSEDHTDDYTENYIEGYAVDQFYDSEYYYLCERPEKLSEDSTLYMVLTRNPKEHTDYIIMFETYEDAHKFCKGYWIICLPFKSGSAVRNGVSEETLKAKNDEIADFMQPYTEDLVCEFFINLGRCRIVRVHHSENAD